MSDKTPWLRGDVEPARNGAYEVVCRNGAYGPPGGGGQLVQWCRRFGWGTKGLGSSCCRWRGLARDPKGLA